MKKFLLVCIATFALVALGGTIGMLLASRRVPAPAAVATRKPPPSVATPSTGMPAAAPAKTGDAEASTGVRSAMDAYLPLSLVQSAVVTPDDQFDTGTFCRVYPVESRDGFLVTFGTGSSGQGTEGYVGGGEGGQGAAYKWYSSALADTGEADYYRYGGGDLATVMAGGYLFHLTGGPSGWRLSKFDATTWKKVAEVDIELSAEEGANDQMLAYANGMLIASSGYAESARGADTQGNEDGKRDPSVGIHTHHHAFDTDLNPVSDWVFDDILHSNGTSMVFVDGTYHLLTSTAFFGDLMVLHYDEKLNYLGSDVLLEGAQWPQGTVYDEENDRYYVAYLAIKGGGQSEVRLAAFDKDWELLSNTAVTDYDSKYFGGRPSLALRDDKIYVAYDKESLDATTREWNKDWQCQISVYEAL